MEPIVVAPMVHSALVLEAMVLGDPYYPNLEGARLLERIEAFVVWVNSEWVLHNQQHKSNVFVSFIHGTIKLIHK